MFPACKAVIHTHTKYSLYFASLGISIPAVIDDIKTVGEVPCLMHTVDDKDSIGSELPEGMVQRNDHVIQYRIKILKQLEKHFVHRIQEINKHGLAFTEYMHGIYAFDTNLNNAFFTLSRVESGANVALLHSCCLHNTSQNSDRNSTPPPFFSLNDRLVRRK